VMPTPWPVSPAGSPRRFTGRYQRIYWQRSGIRCRQIYWP